jgi:hypothetical protein
LHADYGRGDVGGRGFKSHPVHYYLSFRIHQVINVYAALDGLICKKGAVLLLFESLLLLSSNLIIL